VYRSSLCNVRKRKHGWRLLVDSTTIFGARLVRDHACEKRGPAEGSFACSARSMTGSESDVLGVCVSRCQCLGVGGQQWKGRCQRGWEVGHQQWAAVTGLSGNPGVSNPVISCRLSVVPKTNYTATKRARKTQAEQAEQEVMRGE
jgi:hypothetical protein